MPLVGVVGEPLHGQVQIRAVEAGDHLAVLAQAQPLHDVAANRQRRGGRQRDHPGMAEPLDHWAQAKVVGPEVMPPGRDARRLIDHEQRHSQIRQRVDDLVLCQLLGREERVLNQTGVTTTSHGANGLSLSTGTPPPAYDPLLDAVQTEQPATSTPTRSSSHPAPRTR